ncbi:hypothetical protein PYR71_03680 [Rhizobium sp. MC63]|uniref:Uncharacterized protein n=1 Tax=Rhizobium mulingense TaxID=3031128 RepID=A0ACC6N1G2_9HYPH|nr:MULTISPECIES: hypothetical protein [unclassified Rhizobium]MDF0695624.1 hypothetical protein [Rhizobium sp. MC63]MEA3519242.1 hypothetical protein [Rhizobium sp. MJ31]
MRAEDVARRFERKSGYTLIDYSPVALPLYRLTVDAITMVHRDIAPIKEFVMKAINVGFEDSKNIAGFLGLDVSVVDGTLTQLKTDKFVSPLDDDEQFFMLTERGTDILAKAKISSPEDEMLVFLYDRLLLKPVRIVTADLLVPAQVDPLHTIEIRAYPAEGPEVQALAIPEVLKVLEQQAGGRAAFGRDLLRLKRIVRRVRLFRQGVALVYKKNRSSEIVVDFVVDDVRQEAISHTFAERGGPKKMGFLKAIDESATAADLRKFLGPDVHRMLPDAEELDERRMAVSVARIKFQAAEVLAERGSAHPEHAILRAGLNEARQRLTQAVEELASFAARPIAPYERAEFLDLALTQSSKFLAISSRTADRSIVNPQFLKKLKDILKSGCKVQISLSETSPGKPSNAEIELEQVRREHSNLTVQIGKHTPFYHVVCDDKFAVVSNSPMLGNIGKVRTFNHVVGYVLQRTDLVESFVGRVQQSIMKISPKPKEGFPK